MDLIVFKVKEEMHTESTLWLFLESLLFEMKLGVWVIVTEKKQKVSRDIKSLVTNISSKLSLKWWLGFYNSRIIKESSKNNSCRLITFNDNDPKALIYKTVNQK